MTATDPATAAASRRRSRIERRRHRPDPGARLGELRRSCVASRRCAGAREGRWPVDARGGAGDEGISIGPMTAADAEAVLRIFGEGIATGNATLDGVVPDWPQWDAAHRAECRIVARLGREVVGWTALSDYSSREVYRGVAWESVYVAAAARGRGIGGALLSGLIPLTERRGIWTLVAGIERENEASLRLHHRAGFRRIGVQERVGRDPDGRWRDVVLLERRSEVAGR